MQYVLQTKNLSKKYKYSKALDNININIPQGAIYGLVGRNGAGKTTLLRIITGLIKQTSGNYAIFGVEDKALDFKTKRRIAAVVETPSLYLNMTAEENLVMQSILLGGSRDVINDVLHVVNLADSGNKKVKDFSLGMKQRLSIAIAIIGNPDFLILDEPINGLDPEGIIEIRELLLQLNQERNITIIVSSHILGELSKIATNYGFINKGHLVKELSAKQLNDLCRKHIKVVVDQTANLPVVLAKIEGITDYTITSKTNIDIYGEMDITEFALALKEAGIVLKSISEQNEDLESFYINLIGESNK